MSFHGFDPGDRNNWYQSPQLGLFPVGYGGGISGNYYCARSSHLQGNPYSQAQMLTNFIQPNPYLPPPHNPSATIINGHLLPHQFPCIPQTHSHFIPPPYLQPIHPIAPPSPIVPLSEGQVFNPPSPQPLTFVPQPQFPDPKPLSLNCKSFRRFRHRVAMAAKERIAKKTRNPYMLHGVGKYSRSKMYHKRGLWAIQAENGGAFPRHNSKAAVEIMEALGQLRVGRKTLIDTSEPPAVQSGTLPTTGNTSSFSFPVTEPTDHSVSTQASAGSSLPSSIEATGFVGDIPLDIPAVAVNLAGINESAHDGDPHASTGSHMVTEINVAVQISEDVLLPEYVLPAEVFVNTENGLSLIEMAIDLENIGVSDIGPLVVEALSGHFDKAKGVLYNVIKLSFDSTMIIDSGFLNLSAGDKYDKMQRNSGKVLAQIVEKWKSRVLAKTQSVLRGCEMIRGKGNMLADHGVHHFPQFLSDEANVPQVTIVNYGLQATLLSQCLIGSPVMFTLSILESFKHARTHTVIEFEQSILCYFPISQFIIALGAANLPVSLLNWKVGLEISLSSRDGEHDHHLANLNESPSRNANNLFIHMHKRPIETASSARHHWVQSLDETEIRIFEQKLNYQQGFSYFGIVHVTLKKVFSFSSEMHCFSLVPIIFNVGMVTTVQPFSRDWGFQVHQLWPPLMMMRCFSLPLSLLVNDYFKSTLLITAVKGFDVVALHFLYQTKASCHPRSFIVDEFFDFLKSNSKLSFVRYTCDTLLSSDNCVDFLTNMHKFFQHMVGHVHKDEFFMATCSSTSCPPFHALVKKLFLLSPVVAIHSLQPLLADILRDDAQLIFGIMMVVSMNELMFLRSKKQGIQIGYSDIDNGNYCPSMSCSLHLPHFMITWFFEFTSVAIDFGDLALIPPLYFSVPMRTNEAPSLILLFRVVHSHAIEFVNSSHILQGPNREALRTSATSHVGVHLCALLHTWLVTNDENEATAVAFALINSVVAVCIQLSSRKAAFGIDIYVASALIDMYSKCGLSLNFQEKEAFTYFEKMRPYEMFPTPFSYANLLSCCAKLASSSQEKQITTLTLMKISLAKVFEIESDGGLSHNLEKMCLLITGHEWAADVITSDVPLPSVDDLADQLVEVLDLFGIILTTPTSQLSTPFVTDEWLVEADMIIKARQERRIVFAEVLVQFPFLICLRPEGMPYFKGGGMLGLLFYNYILSWANVLSYLSGLCFQLGLSMYIADWTRVGLSGKLVCLGMFADRAI